MMRNTLPAAAILGSGLLVWSGFAQAQVTYAPVQVPGITVTGIRSNSSTTDNVVVTGSFISAGTTTATLYSGSLQALPTAPSSAWNLLTPILPSQTVTSSTFYGPNTPLFDASLPAGDVRAVGSYKYAES